MFTIPCGFIRSQEVVDTMLSLIIKNIDQPSPDSLSFDLFLARYSNKWNRFANGTFQFDFADSSYHISPANLDFSLLHGTSMLPLDDIIGNTLPTDGYYVTPRIFDGRLSITVVGPREFDFARYVPLDTSIRIGSFLVTSKDMSLLPSLLSWKKPIEFYQACAYKIKEDSMLTEFIIFAHADDNIPIDNLGDLIANYTIEFPEYCMQVKKFKTIYAGLKRVALFWETECETYNKGFILVRGYKPLKFFGDEPVNFTDTVARYTDKPELTGLGTHIPGRDYQYLWDTVDYRGETYCYKLLSRDFRGRIIVWDSVCLTIPNAVITYAQAQPNPFSVTTTIKYTIDDDVFLTVKVFDITGKELKTLMENEQVSVGNHELDFHAPEFASQGLYDVVFIAKPIEDPAIELSRAVVKVQLIR